MPEPAAGQLLIKVSAASLNYRDKALVEGIYAAEKMPKGLVPTAERALEHGADPRTTHKNGARASDLVAAVALVVTWSSGFIGAELGARAGAAPVTLPAWRLALLTGILLVVAGVRQWVPERSRGPRWEVEAAVNVGRL